MQVNTFLTWVVIAVFVAITLATIIVGVPS